MGLHMFSYIQKPSCFLPYDYDYEFFAKLCVFLRQLTYCPIIWLLLACGILEFPVELFAKTKMWEHSCILFLFCVIFFSLVGETFYHRICLLIKYFHINIVSGEALT